MTDEKDDNLYRKMPDGGITISEPILNLEYGGQALAQLIRIDHINGSSHVNLKYIKSIHSLTTDNGSYLLKVQFYDGEEKHFNIGSHAFSDINMQIKAINKCNAK